jgi:hypothetical protein
MSMAAPPPVASAVAPPTPATESGATLDVIVEWRDEIVVVERPEPPGFEENGNVRAIYFDFDRYDIRPGDAQTLEIDAA